MEEEEEGDPCEIPSVKDYQFYMVVVFGTTLSMISIISNIIIAIVLLRRRHSNFFFLGLLAVSDTFLSICYFPVIAMETARYRFPLWLVRLWWMYVGPLLALCNIFMSFSCFMIILGTIERYLITVKSHYLECFRSSRMRLSFIMLCIAILLRGTIVFEIEVRKSESNCTGVVEYQPVLTELATSWIYGTVFKVYIRTITTVFLPFGILSGLNYIIVTILRRQQRSASMFRFGSSEHKLKARSATRLLILIVFSYLLANTLNVIVMAWEVIDSDSTEEYYLIYEIMADLVSVLYILTCATRLLVYISCNEEIRHALWNFLCGSCKNNTSDHEYEPIQKQLHYDGSIRQRSVVLGTDFDKVALALVLSQRARDLHQTFLSPTMNNANEVSNISLQKNGSIKSIKSAKSIKNGDTKKDVNENDSFIISNPLANISTPATPTTDQKNLSPNASPAYNYGKSMVKVVPYPDR